MKHKTGFNRNQAVLFPQTIDEVVAKDSIARVIDAFVDSFDLSLLNFKNLNPPADGRPPYHPADLLKLFIYCYMRRYRSSRMMESEVKLNLELIWLLRGLTPDHNTISNFRRDNKKAIKQVFRQTVAIAKNYDLIGAVLIAGDSTKLRAQNSKKNNYSEKKIRQHIDYIDRKLTEYHNILEEGENEINKEEFERKIKEQEIRKKKYQDLNKKLKDTGESQISTSDPDSRLLTVRGNISEVGYNVQTTVDGKHNLPIDYKVTNQTDRRAMGMMVRRAKSILRDEGLTILFDKGYHAGVELENVQRLGIKTLVAEPSKRSNVPNENYAAENFAYFEKKDIYICPQGHDMIPSKKIYIKDRGALTETKYKEYKTKSCGQCHVRNLCISAGKDRIIRRNNLEKVFELNRKNIQNNPELYRRRQAIVEHPFGTLKRQWGFDYILTKKGIPGAESDVGLMFIAYNLRRLISLLGAETLIKGLKALALFFTIFFPFQELKNSFIRDQKLASVFVPTKINML